MEDSSVKGSEAFSSVDSYYYFIFRVSSKYKQPTNDK